MHRQAKSIAFSLDHSRVVKTFRGGWCAATRPNQTGRRIRTTTRSVGPKTSARRKEVLAWSSLSPTDNRSQKAPVRCTGNPGTAKNEINMPRRRINGNICAAGNLCLFSKHVGTSNSKTTCSIKKKHRMRKMVSFPSNEKLKWEREAVSGLTKTEA